jgi:hypothetical protein
VKNKNFSPDLRKGQVFDSVELPNDDEGRGESKKKASKSKISSNKKDSKG